MTDAHFEAFLHTVREHYRTSGAHRDNAAHAEIGDVAVEFERWYKKLGPMGVTRNAVVDAIASLCATMLMRVFDVACAGEDEDFRSALVAETVTSIAAALLTPPEERDTNKAFTYLEGTSVQ